MFIGSDPLAVAPYTQEVTYLEDGDHALVTRAGARVFDAAGAPVERPRKTVAASAALLEKGNYRHFMEKEIHEQPDAVQHTLSAYVDPVTGRATAPGVDFAAIPRLQIVACGTAYLSGLTAKYLFERLAGLPVDVEIASEFRYRDPGRHARHAGAGHQPVGGDRRHLGRPALVQGAGASHRRGGQRPPLLHGAGGPTCCGPRTRGRRSASPPPRPSPPRSPP